MKASIEWLKEFSDINIPTNQLSEILTMTGSKVEDIEESGNDIRNVVVGKILTIEKEIINLKKQIEFEYTIENSTY